MSNEPNTGKDAGHAVAISGAALQERILKNAVTVSDWAAVRLVRDENSSVFIPELYDDYEGHCRRAKRPPLPRKTWIAAMKLAGFQTESGAFVGLSIAEVANFARTARTRE